MSWNVPRFGLLKTALRGPQPVDEPPTPTLPSVAPRPLSKGPPPLPKMTALAPPLGDGAATEEILFREGIDGHAESVPPSGEYSSPLEPTDVLDPEDEWTLAPSTLPPTALDDEWLEEVEVEDPARTRRRRVARIGTAWGLAIAIAVMGSAAFMGARRDLRSAAVASSPTTVETTVARPPVATSTLASTFSDGPQSSSLATRSPSTVRPTTAAPLAVAPPVPRTAAAHASSPASVAARPASTSSPRAGRAIRARHPQPAHARPATRS